MKRILVKKQISVKEILLNRILPYLIWIFVMLWLFSSCGTIREIPVQNTQNTHTVDSTIIQYKDTTIYVPVPVEIIKEITPQLDTLVMETSLAISKSFVDTTSHTLRGELKNKPHAQLEKTVYLPSKEHIVYRDSIVTREIPVEVEIEKPYTPAWAYWSLILNICILCLVAIKIYMKFRKI